MFSPRELAVSIKVPCLEVEYWGSFALQKGFRCTCGSGSFTSLLTMSLRPWSDDLIRKRRADWTTVRSSSEWNRLRVDVFQAEAENGSGLIPSDHDQCHLLSLEKLTYSQDEEDSKNDKMV